MQMLGLMVSTLFWRGSNSLLKYGIPSHFSYEEPIKKKVPTASKYIPFNRNLLGIKYRLLFYEFTRTSSFW
jgi:hypothetical protein